MTCEKYVQCQSTTHTDCHKVMEVYYKHKYYGNIYYICPKCQSAETIQYEQFYKKHLDHLLPFKSSKKAIFQAVINKNKSQPNNEEMSRIVPTINPVINQVVNADNNPVVNETVNPAINPVINQVVNPAINPALNEIINPTIIPAIDPIVNATINLVAKPAKDNRKRKQNPSTKASSSKRNCNYQKVTIIMNGSHVKISFDNVTEIKPPSNFIENVYEEA